MAPDIHRRVSEEVHITAVAQAEATAERQIPSALGEAATMGGLMAEVIRYDPQYRLAQADLRLAGVQLTESHRMILPRLLARGFFEMPISRSGVDTVFSGGLFLRFDLIRACLSQNFVTVAEVTQEVRLEKCRAAAAAAVLSFFNGMSQVEALLQAAEHNRASSRLTTQAALEAEAMFKAGRAASDRWQAWELRRAEKDLEQQRLAARLEKARAGAAQVYRGATAHESALLGLTDTFLKRLAATPAAPAATLAETLEKAPVVVGAKLDMFLAEVGTLEAKLKRLPAVSFDVGTGKIPVQGNGGTIEDGVVPMVGITLPLLDMGDISRGIQRAKIYADQARERMIRAVGTSRLDIESKQQDLGVAAAMLTATDRLRNTASTRRDETVALSRAGTATTLDCHEAAWMLSEAEAAVDQAQRDYRLALLAERAARGDLLDESLQKEVFSKLAAKGLAK